MPGERGGTRLASAGWLAVSLLAVAAAQAENDDASAEIGKALELRPPFLAITPAHAEAPSSGFGPQITDVTRNPTPQPREGQDLPISATVAGVGSSAILTYLVNFGPEHAVPMTAGVAGKFGATIPASAFNKSSMVRWFVTATGSDGQTSRSPPPGKADRYFGTVIADPSISYKIPVMDWYTDDVSGSTTRAGSNGSCVYYLGRFYDNLHVRRKGVTSLSWPKPKLKFRLADKVFVYKPSLDKAAGEKKVRTFDLNSLYYEPGQKSYMREAIAYQVLQDAGGVSAINYHIILNLNGAFYGLYTYTENDDSRYLEPLQRNGLRRQGALIKPTSGSDGNLGFNVPVDQLQYSYKQQNHDKSSFWPRLHDFTQGIAGLANTTRSKFVFDAIELSETINTMAVLTMLLTQDRCTKNYLLYLDLNTSQWQMFAYDLKSALNADAGYPNGRPAVDYCTLECPQWNSPLYCDRYHPQDVTTNSTSPWTFISASSIGRRLMDANAPGPLTGNDPNGPNANITDPDQKLSSIGNLPQGPAGTFNYLIDLITQVPATRQMYMRRLRTLTDRYYTTGKITQMVKDMYELIHEAADIDDRKWHIGNITSGYLQLIEDQIPVRKRQLLEMYGPEGRPALLPAAQPASASLAIGRVDTTSPLEQRFVELVNQNAFAVDVSGWRLAGGAKAHIKPGTVVASGNSLIIARDIVGFQQRTESPRTGQGFQVVGRLGGSPSATEAIQLLNDQGTVVATKATPTSTLAG